MIFDESSMKYQYTLIKLTNLLISQVGSESQFIELSILGNENNYQIFQTDGGFDPTFMPEQIGNEVTPVNEFSNPDGPPQGAGDIINP